MASLRSQAKKQRRAKPSGTVRALLKQIALAFQEKYPPGAWSPNDHPLGKVLDHHLMAAEDKAIGWAAHVFPGTTGNVQKEAGKKERLYNFCKVRLALRYCWAAALHTLCPERMVEEGLMDPAVDFIKSEGHPPRKIKTSSWRLIWNISEVDRLLDNLCFVDQDHHDVYSFQDGPRCEGD